MIGRLTGILREKNPPQIVIEAGGLGYEVDVPMSTYYPLPEPGDTISLFIHFSVRDDGHFLYGFSSDAERHTFRQLLKISGVGARTALAILSGLSVDELRKAVFSQDTALIMRVPGIGKKTAERLLLELKGKLGSAADEAIAFGLPDSEQGDMLHALVALGYNTREATAVLKKLPTGLSTADGIRQALKLLAKI